MILIIIIVFHFESKYINVIQKSKNESLETYGSNALQKNNIQLEYNNKIIKFRIYNVFYLLHSSIFTVLLLTLIYYQNTIQSYH